METQIKQWISELEARWLKLLQYHATEVFAGTFLPSHDQEHHLRVWHWCRTILQEIAPITALNKELVEGVMIAAWFHDLGMAQSFEETHGIIGSKMCESFFLEHKLALPSNFAEIKDAIEKHDSKEASIYNTFVADSTPGILNILSISDDLDAMGHIGIYRYVEIYLHRKVPLRDLGTSILRNASFRYRNINRSLASCPDLAKSTGKLFSTLENFFNLYNQQLLIKKNPDRLKTGHVGLVNHIRKFSLDGALRPVNYLEECERHNYGKIAHTYFKSLKNDLEKTPAH